MVTLLYLYCAFLDTLTVMRGKLTSTATNVQHPPGWCNGSHFAPERSPHTSWGGGGENTVFCQLNQETIRWQVERARVGNFARTPGLYTTGEICIPTEDTRERLGAAHSQQNLPCLGATLTRELCRPTRPSASQSDSIPEHGAHPCPNRALTWTSQLTALSLTFPGSIRL